jgi:hypothetical protein
MLLLREVHQVLMFFIVLLSAYFWGLQKLQLTSTYARLPAHNKKGSCYLGTGATHWSGLYDYLQACT